MRWQQRWVDRRVRALAVVRSIPARAHILAARPRNPAVCAHSIAARRARVIARAIGLAAALACLVAAGIAPARAGCVFGVVARLPVSMDGMDVTVPVTINGKATRLGLDTGAFFSFMSQAKAAELGLHLGPLPEGFYMTGIGGSFIPQYARVKTMGFAGHDFKNVDFIVGGSDVGNAYLGANMLSAVDSEYDLAHGEVKLIEEKDCGKANLGYWAGDRYLALAEMEAIDPQDRHMFGKVTVNGHVLRAMFDTGATSALTLKGAQRAGIDMKAPGVIASEGVTGLGTKARRSWIVRVDSFDIGGEVIQHSPMQVFDEDLYLDGDVDVLIGADFFLAHHILFSLPQRRIYLTYNGGPIFSITSERQTGATKTVEHGMGTAIAVADPTDADGFARRGTARAARQDYAGAIADFSAAIARAPANGGYLDARADAYQAAGQPDLAKADRAAAQRLLPQDGMLLVRQGFDVADHDEAAALADAEAAAKLIPAGSLENQRLVDLFERLHRPQRALDVLAPMLALHTDDHARGWLLKERCAARGLANVELDKAMADCATAIRRDGPDPDYVFNRGLIRLRQKDWAGAIADFDAVVTAAASPAAQWLRGVAKAAAGQADAGAADRATARKRAPGVAAYWTGYGLGGD